MTGLRRRTAAVVAAVVACALPAGSAQAGTHVDTRNVAEAVIQQDLGWAFDVAWNVTTKRGVESVTPLNHAIARASCLQCHAGAVAFQIVLVSGTPSPEVVTPVNIADGQNIACTDCSNVAAAYQWVRVVPASVRFTSAGRATLSAVRERLEALQDAGLTGFALDAAVQREAAIVDDVLDTELVLKSDPTEEADVLEARQLHATDLG
jgi:hypothetical protein